MALMILLLQLYLTRPTTSADISISRACASKPQDTVILNDISCPMTVAQCILQQEQIAAVLNSFKPIETGKGVYADYSVSRVAYMEFDSTDISVVVALDAKYNQVPVSQSDLDAFNGDIINGANCENALERKSSPNLYDALRTALYQFLDSNPESADIRHDEKILIFSSCRADNIEEICDDGYIQKRLGNGLRFGVRDGVNIVMINIGDAFYETDPYHLCLTEYDPNRIFTFDSVIEEDGLESIQHEICEWPTHTPTTDPTANPVCDEQSNQCV